jgi:MOSC domain-containing protein YiiM
LQQGDHVELVERPHPEVSLPFVLRVFMAPTEAETAELAALPLLANEWRERFAQRAAR